jgi:hypothetical protein
VISAPKLRRADGSVPCTFLNATAIAPQNVCWQLQKHPSLGTATFVLSMASSWLSLARQDEAINNLLANGNAAESSKTSKLAA